MVQTCTIQAEYSDVRQSNDTFCVPDTTGCTGILSKIQGLSQMAVMQYVTYVHS